MVSARNRATSMHRTCTGLLVLLLLAGCVALLPPHTARATTRPYQETDEARISIIVEPEPSIQVVPGGTIAYHLTARNTGKSFADKVELRVTYDPGQLTVTGTDFARDGDWIRDAKPGSFKLIFTGVGEDKDHTAIVYTQVADSLPHGDVINLWVEYEWVESGSVASDNRSNTAPVLVGDSNLTSPWVWMAVDPFRAEQGVERGFFSDRFVPGEPVKLWVLSRDGLHRRRMLEGSANGNGHIWIHLPTEHLRPGFYQLIVKGRRSELVAGAMFIVK